MQHMLNILHHLIFNIFVGACRVSPILQMRNRIREFKQLNQSHLAVKSWNRVYIYVYLIPKHVLPPSHIIDSHINKWEIP